MLFTLLFIFVESANCQQYKNSLILETAGFVVPASAFPKQYGISNLMDQHGIYWDHRFNKRMHFTLGLNWWNSYVGNGYYFGAIPSVITSTVTETHDIGLTRTNYKMIDLAIGYSLISTKRHELVVAAGPTFAKGHDSYIELELSSLLPAGWGFSDLFATSSEHSDLHIGIIPSLSYNYHLLNGRFSTGADIKYRKYFSLKSYQLDYGVHIAYNFSRRKL